MPLALAGALACSELSLHAIDRRDSANASILVSGRFMHQIVISLYTLLLAGGKIFALKVSLL